MKTKELLLLCSIFITINCYALEIHNGHLINHKEWTTDGTKMLIKNGKNQHMAMLNQKKMANSIYSNIFNSVDLSKGVVGIPIDVKSSHQVYILNETEQTQQYSYTFGVCAQVENHRVQC